MSTTAPQNLTPTARQLLFNLLLVAEEGRLSASDAVRACALFGFSANNARVALNRLVSAGLAELVGRGAYKLGSQGQTLGQDVGSWRSAERSTLPWTGKWVVALTGGLGRVDRTALKSRQRALALLGMHELDSELFIRPDNLVGGVDQIRSRLFALGLESSAAVFLASGFDAAREAKARQLWPTKDLAIAYKKGQQTLAQSERALKKLPLEEAARHTYLTGNQAIRLLVFDPMLPEPLIAVSERQAFREATLHYETVGRSIWRAFYAAS